MIKFEDGKIDVEQGQIKILRASENMCSDPGWRLVAIVPGDDVSYQAQEIHEGTTWYVTKYRPGAPFLVMRRDPDAALEEAQATINDYSSRVDQASYELRKALEAQTKAEKERDELKERADRAETARAVNADALRLSRSHVEKYEQTLGKIRKLMGDKWFKDNGVEI